MAVLYQEGFDFHKENVFDTVVLMRLVSENEPNYELKNLAAKYIDSNAKKEQTKIKAYLRKNKLNYFSQIPAHIIEPYAIKDVEYTEWFYLYAMKLIDQRDLWELLELEQNVTRALFEVECRGILIDRKFVEERLAILNPQYKKSEMDCYRIAQILYQNIWGKSESLTKEYEKGIRLIQEREGKFKLFGPHDLKKIFNGIGIHSTVLTDKGGESWSKSAFEEIVKSHPNQLARSFARYVSVFRALHKIIDEYYAKFMSLMDINHVLHPSLHQSGTRTGRLSCREPNLQNIPKENAFDLLEIGGDENLSEVRDAFIPRPGFFLLMADWSQIELRLLADYADEPLWKKAFEYGIDIHKVSARAAFGKQPDGIAAAKKWRADGKNLNFALVYGLGDKNLALRIGASPAKTKKFKKNFFAGYPNVAKFSDLVKSVCLDRMMRVCKVHTDPLCKECDVFVQKGWGKNKWGRRRYLEPEKAYVLVNFIIQGGNADLLKSCFTGVHWSLDTLTSGVVNLVHDEIITETAYEEAEFVIPIVTAGMTTQAKFDIPIRVDLQWAPNSWGQAKSLNCEVCNGKGKIYPYTEMEMTELLFQREWQIIE
ncbi:MAG: DNA polymerase, partial [Nitrosopumilus sp.]